MSTRGSAIDRHGRYRLLFRGDDGIVVEVLYAKRKAGRLAPAGPASMTVGEYLQTPESVVPQELVYGVLRVADAPRVFARLPAVIQATGLGRSTIYRLMASGTFPAPVYLGPRAVG